MAAKRTVERREIQAMLERAAADAGLNWDRFVDLGRHDRLDDPELRDLWLIWGDLAGPDNDAGAP
jgi:hypothetical protein